MYFKKITAGLLAFSIVSGTIFTDGTLIKDAASVIYAESSASVSEERYLDNGIAYCINTYEDETQNMMLYV